jgi:hypothetical protein
VRAGRPSAGSARRSARPVPGRRARETSAHRCAGKP